MNFEQLGYNSILETYRSDNGLDSFEVGRVIAEHKERYVVRNEKGEFEGEIIGNLRYSSNSRADFPAVGDWVAISEYDEDKVLIHAVFPRSTIIERQAVGQKGEKQIIATNIDYGLIVQAVDRDFNVNRIERYLTICYTSGVKPLIILNKIDLVEESALIEIVGDVKKRVSDVPVFTISNETQAGYTEFSSIIEEGKTYCMLGSSGVGKSTLLNNLSGRDLMKTGSISDSTSKGRHVTSHRELIVLENGGILIDNPGMREVGIADASGGLEITFDEIMELSAECKYDDCTHTNEVGCAVLEAVESGDLDEDSYQNFLKMEKEKSHFESTQAERKSKGKQLGKLIKDMKKSYRKNNLHLLLLFLLPLFSFFSCSNQDKIILSSPDGNIEIAISNQENFNSFILMYKGDTIIGESKLGLLVNDIDYTSEVVISDFSEYVFENTWESVNGKNPLVHNYYKEYSFKCSKVESEEDFYIIIFRLYDDGFAYRYVFPDEAIKGSTSISRELTSLNFYPDFKYWAYNGENHNIGPILRSEEDREIVRIPMVMQLQDDVFMAIHEAEILDFGPMSIDASGEDNTLGINVNYSSRGEAFQTSWRTFIIGDRVGHLVESDLLVNLNEPCKIEDPSWVKPGKTMWDWRVWGYKADDGFEYGLNTESHKRFIDFASENNIQYLLMDADWYGSEFSEDSDPTSSDGFVDIEENMRYAKEKGVGIILYLNDVGAKKFGLERVIKQFSEWGAAGVKYGFMRGSDEEKVAHTMKVVELCAKYKLMVNFHDNPIPPNGESRTWPNLVSKEFCHSQADAHRSYFPETAVNTALINMIAGPLDACNGWFDFNTSLSRVKVFEELPGTVAAELAKLIVIHTGWMVLPDSPEEYLKKDDLFDCIRKMPAQFDGFKVLDAELDEFVSIARKSGEDWFVGSLTNRAGRTIKVDFSFLPDGKKYEATFYEDAGDTHFLDKREAYKIRKQSLDSNSVVEIKMAPGGGNAIYLHQKM